MFMYVRPGLLGSFNPALVLKKRVQILDVLIKVQ